MSNPSQLPIIIVGDGKWGTAIGSLLRHNQKKFSFWKKGENLPDNSIIVMCIPTPAIREVLKRSGGNLTRAVYVNGAKGVEKESHKLPHQIVTELLGPQIDYFSLIGPSFAGEVLDKVPTLVNIGYRSKKNAPLVRDLFQTDYFRVRLTHDVEALELASAFKNVYAIACGMAAGLGYGVNTRTKLMLLAMEEFYGLSQKLSYPIDRSALPGTIGDLILTCSSEESRNFSFGKLLTRHDVRTSLEMVGETVEGYTTARTIASFEKATRVSLPLARFVHDNTQNDASSDLRKRFTDFVRCS